MYMETLKKIFVVKRYAVRKVKVNTRSYAVRKLKINATQYTRKR